jgi:putative FmdB family regulatory protein
VPLYEYACGSCGHRFEVRQRVVEEPIAVCPKCGGPTRRVFHPVGIIFKGSGWYSTDSRKSESATTSADKAPAEKAGAEKAAAEKPSTDGAKASPTPSPSAASSDGGKTSPVKSSD